MPSGTMVAAAGAQTKRASVSCGSDCENAQSSTKRADSAQVAATAWHLPKRSPSSPAKAWVSP